MARIAFIFLTILFLPLVTFSEDAPLRLPTGMDLSPAGATFDVGNMPLAAVFSPDGKIVLSLSGFRDQGIQIVDPQTKQVTQTIAQKGAFLGMVFSKDGQTLYVSGANENVIHVYNWKDGAAQPKSKINLIQADEKKISPYPAGIALSPDGAFLYVAENCYDTLAVVDLKTEEVIDRQPAGHYPYDVVVAPDGVVYVSAWGENKITRFKFSSGKLVNAKSLNVARHPSALLLNKAGNRLFVASGSADEISIVDTRAFRVLRTLQDRPPEVMEGSTPTALLLSPEGRRLFVAEAMNNSVAVFELSSSSAGRQNGLTSRDHLAGRIPVGWYPTALLQTDQNLYVINGKGRGTRANPKASQGGAYKNTPTEYTLGQLNGTITELPLESSKDDLQKWTESVTQLNHWNSPVATVSYPPFHHVLYIIKENRTYDQMLGDMSEGDSDPSLVFFPRRVSPNHHALAERFGLFDRFFVNAEVSAQGHPWSTSAYVTDFTEKTVHSVYSDRREGESDEDEVANPANGYLWDLAQRSKTSLRIYGEYAVPTADGTFRSTKKAAIPYTSPTYPSYDLSVQDQKRADAWLEEFHGFEKSGTMPALQIFHLPNDHTAGARAGAATPAAYVADNDLALGRIVEAISTSAFWKDTIIFVVEDDSQSGPDHVDSHRSVTLVISAYNKGGVIHRFVNTTDIIATMERILGLGSLSQFDHYGRPLQDIFSAVPNLTPYKAIVPEQSMQELNPDDANAKQSLLLNLQKEDLSDDDLFNRILWRAVKGENVAYPERTQISLLQIRQEE